MTTTLPEIKRQTPTLPPVAAEEEVDSSIAALAALRERLPPIRPPSPLVRRHRPAPPVVSVATLNARAPRTLPLPSSAASVLKRIDKDENNDRATVAAEEQREWTHACIEWLRVVCDEMEGTVTIRETSNRDTVNREEEREWSLIQQGFHITGQRLSQRIIQNCHRRMNQLAIEMMDQRKEEQALEANERTVLRRRELIYRPVQDTQLQQQPHHALKGTIGVKQQAEQPEGGPQDGGSPPKAAALLAQIPKRPPSADRSFAETGRKRWGDEKQYREALIRLDTAMSSLDPREQFRREEMLGFEMTAWLKIQRDALKDRHRIDRILAARGTAADDANARASLNEERYMAEEAHSATAEAVVGHVVSCALVMSGQEQERHVQKEKPQSETSPAAAATVGRRTSDVAFAAEPPKGAAPQRRSSKGNSSPTPPAALLPVVATGSAGTGALDVLFTAQSNRPSAPVPSGLEVLAVAAARTSSPRPPAAVAPKQAAAKKPDSATPPSKKKEEVASSVPHPPPAVKPSAESTKEPVTVKQDEQKSPSFAFPSLNVLCDVLLDQRREDPSVVSRWLPLLEAAANETALQATKSHPSPVVGAEYFYRLLTAQTSTATRDHIDNVVWRKDRHHRNVQFAIELIPTRWSSYQSKEELEYEEQLEMVYREMLTREKLIEEQLEELWEGVEGARAVAHAKPSPQKGSRTQKQ